MPFGGAAGLEVQRRMLRSWGIDGRRFACYALLINLWGVGCKLILPVVAVVALVIGHEAVPSSLRVAGVSSGVGFLLYGAGGAALLVSRRWARWAGDAVGRLVRMRRVGRAASRRGVGAQQAMIDLRQDCGRLMVNGWGQLTAGILGYAALQCLLLGTCLQISGAGNTVPEVITGFAVERVVTILPVTPGGMGVGDLGLVTTLLAFGGDPAGVAAATVLYRSFVFAVQVPVGASLLGFWLLTRESGGRRGSAGEPVTSEAALVASTSEASIDPDLEAESPSPGPA
jgi:uncharacterized membrane protein YbhN (UPF0104 family)